MTSLHFCHSILEDSLTVIEALACGDRVVMTDLPGVKEWIDTYAPGADIRYVTLPLMRNVDEESSCDTAGF